MIHTEKEDGKTHLLFKIPYIFYFSVFQSITLTAQYGVIQYMEEIPMP